MARSSFVLVSLFLYSTCIADSSIGQLTFCNADAECPTDIPNCCSWYAFHGVCKQNCSGNHCDSSDCDIYECCVDTVKCIKCRDECSTNEDCPKDMKYCCAPRAWKTDNVCDLRCYGKGCVYNSDCAVPGQCCRSKYCSNNDTDCKTTVHHTDAGHHVAITAFGIFITVVVGILAFAAAIVGMMACCGFFKREKFAGVIADPRSATEDQREQIVTNDYIQLDDMNVQPRDEEENTGDRYSRLFDDKEEN